MKERKKERRKDEKKRKKEKNERRQQTVKDKRMTMEGGDEAKGSKGLQRIKANFSR